MDEYLALYELYYTLRDFQDPSFQEKYSEWFSHTEPFFHGLSGQLEFPFRLEQTSIETFTPHLVGLLPSKEAYFGLKGTRNLRDSFALKLTNSLPTQNVKPKRFMGVGYRDKGHRRNKAVDGTPAWQEVASHFSELENRANSETDDPTRGREPT